MAHMEKLSGQVFFYHKYDDSEVVVPIFKCSARAYWLWNSLYHVWPLMASGLEWSLCLSPPTGIWLSNRSLTELPLVSYALSPILEDQHLWSFCSLVLLDGGWDWATFSNNFPNRSLLAIARMVVLGSFEDPNQIVSQLVSSKVFYVSSAYDLSMNRQ